MMKDQMKGAVVCAVVMAALCLVLARASDTRVLQKFAAPPEEVNKATPEKTLEIIERARYCAGFVDGLKTAGNYVKGRNITNGVSELFFRYEIDKSVASALNLAK